MTCFRFLSQFALTLALRKIPILSFRRGTEELLQTIRQSIVRSDPQAALKSFLGKRRLKKSLLKHLTTNEEVKEVHGNVAQEVLTSNLATLAEKVLLLGRLKKEDADAKKKKKPKEEEEEMDEEERDKKEKSLLDEFLRLIERDVAAILQGQEETIENKKIRNFDLTSTMKRIRQIIKKIFKKKKNETNVSLLIFIKNLLAQVVERQAQLRVSQAQRDAFQKEIEKLAVVQSEGQPEERREEREASKTPRQSGRRRSQSAAAARTPAGEEEEEEEEEEEKAPRRGRPRSKTLPSGPEPKKRKERDLALDLKRTVPQGVFADLMGLLETTVQLLAAKSLTPKQLQAYNKAIRDCFQQGEMEEDLISVFGDAIKEVTSALEKGGWANWADGLSQAQEGLTDGLLAQYDKVWVANLDNAIKAKLKAYAKALVRRWNREAPKNERLSKARCDTVAIRGLYAFSHQWKNARPLTEEEEKLRQRLALFIQAVLPPNSSVESLEEKDNLLEAIPLVCRLYEAAYIEDDKKKKKEEKEKEEKEEKAKKEEKEEEKEEKEKEEKQEEKEEKEKEEEEDDEQLGFVIMMPSLTTPPMVFTKGDVLVKALKTKLTEEEQKNLGVKDELVGLINELIEKVHRKLSNAGTAGAAYFLDLLSPLYATPFILLP